MLSSNYGQSNTSPCSVTHTITYRGQNAHGSDLHAFGACCNKCIPTSETIFTGTIHITNRNISILIVALNDLSVVIYTVEYTVEFCIYFPTIYIDRYKKNPISNNSKFGSINGFYQNEENHKFPERWSRCVISDG